MVQDIITLGHKQAFCWIDDWSEMTLEDIRNFEDETSEILKKVWIKY